MTDPTVALTERIIRSLTVSGAALTTLLNPSSEPEIEIEAEPDIPQAFLQHIQLISAAYRLDDASVDGLVDAILASPQDHQLDIIEYLIATCAVLGATVREGVGR